MQDGQLSLDSFYALKLSDGAEQLHRKSPRYDPVLKIVMALASSRQRCAAQPHARVCRAAPCTAPPPRADTRARHGSGVSCLDVLRGDPSDPHKRGDMIPTQNTLK